MTQRIRITIFLIIELLGTVVWGSPFSHRWAKFKTSEGKDVFVNFDNIKTSSDPAKIDVDKVQFHLYTKNNPSDSVRLYINDYKGLNSSNYNLTAQTKFLVHGFLNDLNSETIQSIKNSFLNRDTNENYNIIAVDWSYYTTIYTDVVYKSKGVGQIIGQFADFLVSNGTKLEDLHLIGHSLGAHACGFASASMKSKVARITGLDPALPGFDVTNSSARLDSRDADFVDCIHTCGGFLGIDDPICTADYYPNGGKDQPGCNWFDFGSCSHGRSHEFFAESIMIGHYFPSLSCETMDFDQEGTCFENGALMGYPASINYTGILFTATNSAFPYSMNSTTVT